MKEVRFGLVGCGRIGSTADDRVRAWPVADSWLPYSHASAITATPGARLVAACDIDLSAVEDAARRYGPLAVYTDWEKMLARENLDVVAVATRTAQRPEIVLAAVGHAVKGIYCEKPLSNSLEDADALASALQSAGTHFVYGTKRRFMPVYQDVRKRLAAGEIGQVLSVVIRLGFGSLLWTYPHAVDMAAFFAGDAGVEWVQADLVLDRACVATSVVDADPAITSATLRFRNAVTAVILPGEGMDVEIVGREGLVRIDGDGTIVRWRRRRDAADLGWLLQEAADPQGTASSGTQRSIAALVGAVTDEAAAGYGIQDAVHNQEVLFAMVESHLGGGIRITLPLERRGLKITGRTGNLFA